MNATYERVSLMTHKQFSGMILTVLGTLALVQVLGIFHLGLAFWPALLLYLGLEIVWGSLRNRWHRRSASGAVLGAFVAALGLTQILGNAGVGAAGELMRMIWPVLLVVFGLCLLVGRKSWCWRW